MQAPACLTPLPFPLPQLEPPGPRNSSSRRSVIILIRANRWYLDFALDQSLLASRAIYRRMEAHAQREVYQVQKVIPTVTGPVAIASAPICQLRRPAKFSCPVPECGKTFSRYFNLKGAYWCLHPTRQMCNDLTFNTGHMRTHAGEDRFTCRWPRCMKTFATEDEYKRHRKLHSPGPHDLTCGVCEKSFRRLDALSGHRT